MCTHSSAPTNRSTVLGLSHDVVHNEHYGKEQIPQPLFIMVARFTELKEMCTFHKLQHECDAVVHAAVLMLKCYIVQPYI